MSKPQVYLSAPPRPLRPRLIDGVPCYVVKFTDACSGCNTAGCRECGYTGKRRRRYVIPVAWTAVTDATGKGGAS